MREQKLEYYDRRSDDDRRKVHDLNYFLDENVERRRFSERRGRRPTPYDLGKSGAVGKYFY